VNTAAPSRVKTAHEWARDRLRHEIVTGVYPPGSPLKQTELAAALGTSVTPVREAMRDLVGEGLILVDPQRVARVRELDPEDAVEINEMRLRLEPLAARRAAERATPDDVERIRALAVEADEAPDDATWLHQNYEFHVAVIESAHSPRLAAMLVNLRNMSSFYLAAMVRTRGAGREKSSAEHLALVAAIAAGDADQAERLMRAHVLPTAQLATLGRPPAA
jgi:DNA-binding GntR family transcriptional regulator